MPRNTKRLPEDATPDLVQRHHQAFVQNSRYATAEAMLDAVFGAYRSNASFQNILIKSCVLNALYSTNINAIYAVAERIMEVEIDDRLARADQTLVNDIARVQVNEETMREFYSFASKYCHFHVNSYPIYDSFVEELLVHYQIKRPYMEMLNLKKNRTKKYIREYLHQYDHFCDTLTRFRDQFVLNNISAREMDHFLWGYGRELYPKAYKKRKSSDQGAEGAAEDRAPYLGR